jgi:hypothetical protein
MVILLQFYTMVGEMLSHAEIGEYLDCNPVPGTDVTLLGLSLDKLDKTNPHKSVKMFSLFQHFIVLILIQITGFT